MKIQFWSVGKAHETYIKQGVNEFTKRINHYYQAEWHILPTVKNAGSLPGPELIMKEGEYILNGLRKDDYLVVLDERGRQLSSGGLADLIQSKANDNVKQLIFLIGGAYGIDEAVLKRSNFCWSLSLLVFPHQLVRLILAEQVYRACTIIRNEKYHHS
ncbi:MAG: 23S rRNA (pseudouridine(1915)-N(3))-methyltransferase RlmH [Chitinophagaceae bacterium]